MQELKVHNVMTRGVITCNPEMALDEVARIMSDAEISAVAIVDQDGKLKGVVSQFDLLKYYGKDLTSPTAHQVMSIPAVHILPDDTVEHAAVIMAENHIHRLIVTSKDGSRAEGVISAADVIRTMRKIGG